jgi:hypothetical protein
MNTRLTRIMAAGLAASALLGAVTMASTPASARYVHRYGYVHPYHHYRHYGYYRHRHYYGGAPLVGALIGGIAAGALAPHYYYGPPPYYYGPGPYYYGW